MQLFIISDSKERVIVTHIESPESFYVQLIKFKAKLNKLTQSLTAYARRNSTPVKKIEISKNRLGIFNF